MGEDMLTERKYGGRDETLRHNKRLVFIEISACNGLDACYEAQACYLQSLVGMLKD